ncbi:sulfite exporter TauE/SafE family protein [Sphingomonas changnyeongensis]|uniref:sulfite exporter TauE/SafE family protein n=1 Tax=Sphingomonas changnyeongensis TaxID=2698679 RepID=UPI002E18DAE2
MPGPAWAAPAVPAIWPLAGGFALAAALYASVGFGGGSTYAALLALSGFDYRLLPAIALSCNLIVVTGGTIRFAAVRQLPWRRALPLAAIAAPFAWAGGLTPVAERLFLGLLGVSLLVAALALLLAPPQPVAASAPDARRPRWREPVIGAGIGYLSGLVGIGGGIFLAPVLHLTRWAPPRQVAATASLFILVNSLAGLAGQVQKLAGAGLAGAAAGAWPLALAVLVGGRSVRSPERGCWARRWSGG